MGKPIDLEWTHIERCMYRVITDAVNAIGTFTTALDYEINADENGRPINSTSLKWPISDVVFHAAIDWGNRMRNEYL